MGRPKFWGGGARVECSATTANLPVAARSQLRILAERPRRTAYIGSSVGNQHRNASIRITLSNHIRAGAVRHPVLTFMVCGSTRIRFEGKVNKVECWQIRKRQVRVAVRR